MRPQPAGSAVQPNAEAVVHFEDRMLRCADCGQSFIFTVGEQRFYQQKNFTNDPKRCAPCRHERKRRT